MAAKRDYYEVLGVARDADAAALKQAYRQIAREHHPDRSGGDARSTKLFKEATEAYGVLSDAEKRARYDAGGHAAVDGRGMPFDPSAFGEFTDLFGVFSELFGVDLGGRGGRRHGPRRGEDLLTAVTITLEEVASGVDRDVEVRRAAACEPCRGSGSATGRRLTCPTCHGRGQVVVRQGFISLGRPCPKCGGEGEAAESPCTHCGGAGRVAVEKTLRVHVPPGIEDGQRIRLAREGSAGQRGGQPGDFFVDVSVAAHATFEREGTDLHRRLPVTYSQAALGARLDVATLDGQVSVKLDAGTQSGQAIRLKGQGLARLSGRGRARGDLYLHVRVRTPRKLSRRERELIEELASHEKPAEAEDEWDERGVVDRIRDYFG